MTKRSIAAAVLATAMGLVFLPPPEVAAEGTPVRVLVSNSMKAALEELQPQCERAIGRPLALQFNSTAAVKKKIEAGAEFDVTGIGIRAGAAKPDILRPRR
jgi:ABC-type molybdate transport system substrate-binding protein